MMTTYIYSVVIVDYSCELLAVRPETSKSLGVSMHKAESVPKFSKSLPLIKRRQGHSHSESQWVPHLTGRRH